MGGTIDAVGANVETRDFRTCSRACLRDSRNPARLALVLSFLPVKRRAELKSAFRNCALPRKHPQGGKCKHALDERAGPSRRRETTKAYTLGLRERER